MDQDHVARLYRRYGPSLYARCKRILADAALAEDAVQEVFVRLVPYLERQLPDDEVSLLSARLAVNHCLDLLRRRRRETLVDAVPERAGQDWDHLLQDRNLLRSVLRDTPEKLRAPALLHHFEGMSQQEIARTLELSPRTVFTRLQDFRAFLAERYQEGGKR